MNDDAQRKRIRSLCEASAKQSITLEVDYYLATKDMEDYFRVEKIKKLRSA